MKTNNRSKAWLLAVALVATGEITSRAALSYFNVGYYTDAQNSALVVAQGYGHATYATAFSVDWQSGGALPAGHTDPFVSFCLDINTVLANGWWKSGGYSEVPLNSDSSPADRQELGLYRAASLYRHFAPGILTAVGNGSGFTWNDKERGAALQLAIWEVLYEKGTTFSIDKDLSRPVTDQFYASSVNASIRTLANSMLSSAWNTVDLNLETTFWNAANADGTPRSSQDLIGPILAVPEPGKIGRAHV